MLIIKHLLVVVQVDSMYLSLLRFHKRYTNQNLNLEEVLVIKIHKQVKIIIINHYIVYKFLQIFIEINEQIR